jgi:hypothetical protein
MAVDRNGALFIVGAGSFDGAVMAKSSNAQTAGSAIVWDFSSVVDLDGYVTGSAPINPVGILGQVNIDIDRSTGPGSGNVYVLATLPRLSNGDPGDVMFARSTDGGYIFDQPQRLNTDPSTSNYQWFGTMSVAPNGRIDVIWLDTRDDFPGGFLSSLYYCYSDNQGETWSINKKLSDFFDPSVGYPQQAKMGDYFDMVSDDAGAHLAWANTLNGEQDVYYTHIIPQIVGMNENPGQSELALTGNPNPFRTQTSIRYRIHAECFVKLVICDISGKEIKSLVEEKQPSGDYSVEFSDESLVAGFYLCRLSAGPKTAVTRLVKLK